MKNIEKDGIDSLKDLIGRAMPAKQDALQAPDYNRIFDEASNIVEMIGIDESTKLLSTLNTINQRFYQEAENLSPIVAGLILGTVMRIAKVESAFHEVLYQEKISCESNYPLNPNDANFIGIMEMVPESIISKEKSTASDQMVQITQNIVKSLNHEDAITTFVNLSVFTQGLYTTTTGRGSIPGDYQIVRDCIAIDPIETGFQLALNLNNIDVAKLRNTWYQAHQ